ncbi:MAG: glutathione S-transferase [Myxococcales bacterium]|nr:glutathione S-transferase [Myxococcales bacterium]
MPHLKLHYFDFHGGRGEVARLALFIGDIPFEDHRIKAEWSALKAGMRFGALPVLEVDGEALSQSNTINRYVGTLAGLYPTDPWAARQCDEVMDAVEDISSRVSATFSIKDDAQKKVMREALLQGPIPTYAKQLQTILEKAGGEYFVEGRLTVADLKVYLWVNHLKSGKLDHMPPNALDTIAPALIAHHGRISGDDRIQRYYAQFS